MPIYWRNPPSSSCYLVTSSWHERAGRGQPRWFDLVSGNTIELIRYEAISFPAAPTDSCIINAAKRVFVAGHNLGLRLHQHANGQYVLLCGIVHIPSTGVSDTFRQSVPGEIHGIRIMATVPVHCCPALFRYTLWWSFICRIDDGLFQHRSCTQCRTAAGQLQSWPIGWHFDLSIHLPSENLGICLE